MERGFQHYSIGDASNNAPQPLSLSDALSRINIQQRPKDTQSGLYLAATVAQNRRDWAQSWQNFSSLNDRFQDTPDIILKSMSLALANGEFDKAAALALSFDKKHLSNDAINEHETFQFARMFLALIAIKENRNDDAHTHLNAMENTALMRLAGPILSTWIDVSFDKKSISKSIKGLSPIQIYYKALAAEYNDQAETAVAIMDDLDISTITGAKTKNIIAFYIRHGQKDKALGIAKNDNLSDVTTALSANGYNPPPNATLHMNGINAALALAFEDFSLALIGERATDSALLFARMSEFLSPEYKEPALIVADIFDFHGQENRALDSYKTISHSHEKYDISIAKQIDIHTKTDDFENAKDVIDQALKYHVNNAYFNYLAGNVYRGLKDYEKSIMFFSKAETLGKQKNNGVLPTRLLPLYYARAISYDLGGQWDKAEVDLHTAMDTFPNNPLILNYLGYAYADRNIHLDKAKEYISMAVMAASNDPYVIDSMGWILYRGGEYKKAIGFLERAAKMRPYHMVINDHLGDAYWKLGRKLEAHYMWQRAARYFDSDDEEQVRMIEETRKKIKSGL